MRLPVNPFPWLRLVNKFLAVCAPKWTRSFEYSLPFVTEEQIVFQTGSIVDAAQVAIRVNKKLICLQTNPLAKSDVLLTCGKRSLQVIAVFRVEGLLRWACFRHRCLFSFGFFLLCRQWTRSVYVYSFAIKFCQGERMCAFWFNYRKEKIPNLLTSPFRGNYNYDSWQFA